MRFSGILTDRGGNVVVPFAIIGVALVAVAGGAVDLLGVHNQRKALQVAVDAGVMAAAHEMAITSNDADRIEFVASAVVASFVDNPEAVIKPEADPDNKLLSVRVSAPARTRFPGPLSHVDKISVEATAELVGMTGNICLIGLSGGHKRTIELNNQAALTAKKCAIYSNSADTKSMSVHSTATLIYEDIFLVGGFEGSVAADMNAPVTDSPAIDDPLAARPAPAFDAAACDHTDLVITDDAELEGGVYCGGLTIDGGEAELEGGVYIIKDGPLTVRGGGTLEGDYVGFYLTGTDAKINFETDSHISLSAPKSGEMTGLLVYADPSNPAVKDGKKLKGGHAITSDDASRLVGTLYLPDDKLIVDGSKPVAERSEYTVIIAKAFELSNGPNLVIKTDYHLSDIPVPEGVGPIKSARSVLKY